MRGKGVHCHPTLRVKIYLPWFPHQSNTWLAVPEIQLSSKTPVKIQQPHKCQLVRRKKGCPAHGRRARRFYSPAASEELETAGADLTAWTAGLQLARKALGPPSATPPWLRDSGVPQSQ